MSEAKKITEWFGNTDSHLFEIKYFEDEEQGMFIAHVEAKSLDIPPSRRVPGKAPRRVEPLEVDTLKDESLDLLVARCRAQVTGRYGQIRNFGQKEQ